MLASSSHALSLSLALPVASLSRTHVQANIDALLRSNMSNIWVNTKLGRAARNPASSRKPIRVRRVSRSRAFCTRALTHAPDLCFRQRRLRPSAVRWAGRTRRLRPSMPTHKHCRTHTHRASTRITCSSWPGCRCSAYVMSRFAIRNPDYYIIGLKRQILHATRHKGHIYIEISFYHKIHIAVVYSMRQWHVSRPASGRYSMHQGTRAINAENVHFIIKNTLLVVIQRAAMACFLASIRPVLHATRHKGHIYIEISFYHKIHIAVVYSMRQWHVSRPASGRYSMHQGTRAINAENVHFIIKNTLLVVIQRAAMACFLASIRPVLHAAMQEGNKYTKISFHQKMHIAVVYSMRQWHVSQPASGRYSMHQGTRAKQKAGRAWAHSPPGAAIGGAA